MNDHRRQAVDRDAQDLIQKLLTDGTMTPEQARFMEKYDVETIARVFDRPEVADKTEVTDRLVAATIRRGLYDSVLSGGIRELPLLPELDDHVDDAGLLLTLANGAEFVITVVQTEQPAPYVEGRVY
jgi:hypothetical protein